MTRWNPAVGLLALIGFVVCGCAQNTFISEATYKQFADLNGLPRDLQSNPAVADPPPIEGEAPGTVSHLEHLTPRYVSLQECIALALQQGNVGSQSVRFPGVTEDLVTFGGPGVGVVGSDSIRVLSLNPAFIGANIDRELARFDALYTSSLTWTNTDEPLQGLASFSNGMAASFINTIAKPLPTGGTAGITFENDYKLLARPPTGAFSVLNPSYTSKLTFGLEQPLLRYAGVDVNQVLPAFAGSNLFPGLNGRRATGEGILLARLRFDQQRADFERSVNFQLLNVESAYWNLYGAYVTLFSTEQAMRMAYLTWKITLAQFEVGAKTGGREFLAGARAQYEQFRATRVQNVDSVLESERLLRVLLGLRMGDKERLVPADAPTLAPYLPDWKSALQDALTLRPELLVARQDLRTKQLNVIAQATLLKPDLRFQSTYTPVGLGTNLDGSGQYLDSSGTYRSSNAFRSLASDHFNDWSLGFLLNMPLGFRYEHGTVRQAKLQLAQSYALLKEQELKAQNQLAKSFRLLQTYHQTIEIRRQERQAWAERLQVYLEQARAGKITFNDLNLFDAERQWTAALTNEYLAIVNYNLGLAQFEFTKGTIMKYDNVALAEGPIPQCAVMPAKEHERERSRSLVLREREGAQQQLLRRPPAGIASLPIVPTHGAPTLPALEEAAQMIPDPAGLTKTPGKPVVVAPGKAPAFLPDLAELKLPAPTTASLSAASSVPAPSPAAPAAPRARLDVALPESPEVRGASSSVPVRLGAPVGGTQ